MKKYMKNEILLSPYGGLQRSSKFVQVPGPREKLGIFFLSPPDIFSKGHFSNVISSRVGEGVAKYELGGVGENKDMKNVNKELYFIINKEVHATALVSFQFYSQSFVPHSYLIVPSFISFVLTSLDLGGFTGSPLQTLKDFILL